MKKIQRKSMIKIFADTLVVRLLGVLEIKVSIYI